MSRVWIVTLLRTTRESYWFLPLVLVVLAHGLAFTMVWLDRVYPEFGVDVLPRALRDTQAAGARALLSLMASSIIGVTGVMFSLTMVAVSFASGNFGPRLVSNFMRDRGNQWSLGVLIATFAYCLQVLRTVKGPVAEVFVPHLALLVALILTLISILVMIYFIHHVPETINVGNITAGLSRRLEAAVRAEVDAEPFDRPKEQPRRPPIGQPTLDWSGYIATVDLERLDLLSRRNGWRFLLLSQPGDFVPAGTPVMEIYPDDNNRPPDPKTLNSLRACFGIGDGRTEEQNPLFLTDQLVEIAVRALSPGVNDPFTAIDCLNRMYAALHVSLTYEGGLDDRLLGPMDRKHLTFDVLMEATFGKSHFYVAQDPLTLAHMAKLLSQLRPYARDEREEHVIDAMAERLREAAD
ncbi:DUF2254 domain-containing protein [Tropicimonas isoalkanivorans]|uniref:Uncharacterized membrane protein n=1 Tax=Tropicimonas isoalkanivorans TaxID=441112 RepID=A0A1I1M171_9RHOB|nr:DUF2254 domain-containing protein [Tropicimonas isoalkanivorans]SFC79257.1 Uncharacterized membrane protein [Tropicimonas isoalkanivorans]